MDANKIGYDYTQSEEFMENLKKQEKFYNNYISSLRYRKKNFPFGGSFMEHYSIFRACLASLRSNPDIMADEDFQELCDCWQGYNEGHRFRYDTWKINFNELEERYKRLLRKPIFQENPLFHEIYGRFIKSVYGLFNGDYWDAFFGLED